MISTPFCPVCGAANEPERTHCFACGESLATGKERTEAPKGALLRDRYQPGALLGSGGYSVVYHARDMWEGGRDVAIKQINLQGLNAEETIEATNTFNREVQLLSALSHPQVPRLYDHFGDSDHWYLVLEYLEGSTLEVYLERCAARSQPIQVDEALSIALQVCTVLEYLHTRQPPVIFRDLKPGNIIRTPAGKLSLIDFGIARHYRPGLVRDTQRLGSPGYAAPEQYGRSQTTPQADIYSLGALLHALLSGQDPATQPRGLAPLHLKSYPGEAELAELVQRMLAPDPLERPASVSEVAAVLRQLEQNQHGLEESGRIWIPPTPQEVLPEEDGARQIQIMLPAPAPQIVLPPRGYRTRRRNVLVGLGALAVAWVGGQAIWRTMAHHHHPFPEPEGIFGANLLYTFRGHTDAVWNSVWSPDGMRIASCSLDDTVQVWDSLDGGRPFVYLGHTQSLMDVAWSPDGMRIASASEDGTVQLWNSLDGSKPLVYQGHADAVQEANWSPDGQFIASCSLDKTVQIWNAASGNLVGTYRGHKDGVLAAKWSPDGSRIATSSQDNTVHVWEAATLRPLVVYQGHSAPVPEIAWSPDGSRVVSSSDDKTAQVWSASDGSNLVTYTGHKDGVNSVSWSPDGSSWIVSSSDDGTAQIWSAFDGDQILTYSGHQGPVMEVNWSPSGSMIASASEDSSVQIWSFEKM